MESRQLTCSLARSDEWDKLMGILFLLFVVMIWSRLLCCEKNGERMCYSFCHPDCSTGYWIIPLSQRFYAFFLFLLLWFAEVSVPVWYFHHCNRERDCEQGVFIFFAENSGPKGLDNTIQLTSRFLILHMHLQNVTNDRPSFSFPT